jgi:hypothetical protein
VSSLSGISKCIECGASFVVARPHGETRIEGEKICREIARTLEARMHTAKEECKPVPSFEFHGDILSRSPSEIDEGLDVLDIPKSIGERARVIYRSVSRTQAERGRQPEKGLAAASVYAACKENGVAKSPGEIAGAFGISESDIEQLYTYLLNEMGYLHPIARAFSRKYELRSCEPTQAGTSFETIFAGSENRDLQNLNEERFLEKKGTYEFFRLLKENPRRWKTLEKELALSPRTLSERISQGLEFGLIERVRRLKIGATYYRLTKKGSDVFEAMTGHTSIY